MRYLAANTLYDRPFVATNRYDGTCKSPAFRCTTDSMVAELYHL